MIGTITPGEAAGRAWDVLVAGAGPAGALAARQLARRGRAVLLVEKQDLPRAKVCGACLNRNALAVLQRAGLGDLVFSLGGVPLTGLRLAGWGRAVRLPLPEGRGLSRRALDAALVGAACEAGARLLPRTRATLGTATGKGREVLLSPAGETTGVRVTARVVLDACGLGGMRGGDNLFAERIGRRSRLGVGATVEGAGAGLYPPGVIHMAVGGAGYVGLVRVEDGRLNVAAALDPGALGPGRGPGPAVACILRQAGLPPPDGLAGLDWRGTPALTRRASPLARDGVFRIGDAAGYVEPFTGEGMAWALAGAAAAAPLAEQAVAGWRPALAAEWEAAHRRLVGNRQLICRLLAAVLRRPRLARGMIHLLQLFPAFSRPFVRRLNHSPAIPS